MTIGAPEPASRSVAAPRDGTGNSVAVRNVPAHSHTLDTGSQLASTVYSTSIAVNAPWSIDPRPR
jgi:hypothetical protein